MDRELRKIQRHNRIIWVILGILVLLSVISVTLALTAPKPSTIQQNYIGQNGKDGQSVQGPQGASGYTPVKGVDYVDGKDAVVDYELIFAHINQQIAALPKPADGTNGSDGADGTNGSDGADARTSEFDCMNGDFVTRYEGDDNWRVIQEDSVACKEKHK